MPFRHKNLTYLTVPGNAGPGQARIFIGAELPPPLNTYVPFDLFPSATGYAAAIVFYSEGDDDTYMYLAVVEDAASTEVGGVVLGYVLNGVVREQNPGQPRGISWIGDALSNDTEIRILANLIRSDSGSDVRLTALDNIDLLAVLNNIDMHAVNGAITMDADSTLVTTGGAINLNAGSEIQVQSKRAFMLTDMDSASLSAAITLDVVPAVANTLTFTTVTPNARFEAIIVCDFNETVAGAVICLGELHVDTVQQTGLAEYTPQAALDRACVMQTYEGVLASAGSHTFEQIVSKSAAVGTVLARATHTRLLVKIYETGG